MRIVAHYEYLAVWPVWTAYDDDTYGGDEGDPIGRGATIEEAVADLLERIEERGSK